MKTRRYILVFLGSCSFPVLMNRIGKNYVAGKRPHYMKDIVIDIGAGEGGDHVKVGLPIENTEYSPLTVIGMATSCNCSSVSDLPVTIPAGKSIVIQVNHERPKIIGQYNIKVTFILRGGVQKELAYLLKGDSIKTKI